MPLPLILMVDVDGQETMVTLNELLELLKDDERQDFKDLIAMCREDSHWLQAAEKGELLPVKDVNEVIQRLSQNVLMFYLIVRERLRKRLVCSPEAREKIGLKDDDEPVSPTLN